MWLCTQIRSQCRGGGTPRGRYPGLSDLLNSCPFIGTGTESPLAGVLSAAACVLAHRLFLVAANVGVVGVLRVALPVVIALVAAIVRVARAGPP